jgi:hypothetical protein
MVGNGNLGALMLESEAAMYEKSKRKDGSWPPWDMLVRPFAVVEHGMASGTHCERPAGNHLPASDPASCNCGSSFSIGKRGPIHNKSRAGANVGWRRAGTRAMISGSPIAHVLAGLACLHPLPTSNVTLPSNFTLTRINIHVHLFVKSAYAYLFPRTDNRTSPVPEIVIPFGIAF